MDQQLNDIELKIIDQKLDELEYQSGHLDSKGNMLESDGMQDSQGSIIPLNDQLVSKEVSILEEPQPAKL